MCLAVPAKILSIDGNHAVVDINGARRDCVLAMVKDAQPGDYVLLHAGFAIKKWTQADYDDYLAIMEDINSKLD